jgi:hypothetical protein
MLCYLDLRGDQTVTTLWEAIELTPFHDAELAEASRAINEILRTVERRNRDSGRKLSFIQFQNRHLLVWARYGVVGPSDDRDTIAKALKLRRS